MLQEMVNLGAAQHPQQLPVVHDGYLRNAFAVHGFKNVNDALMRPHPAKSRQWSHEGLYPGLIPKLFRDRRYLLPCEDTFQIRSIQYEKPSRVRTCFHTVFKSG